MARVPSCGECTSPLRKNRSALAKTFEGRGPETIVLVNEDGFRVACLIDKRGFHWDDLSLEASCLLRIEGPRVRHQSNFVHTLALDIVILG